MEQSPPMHRLGRKFGLAAAVVLVASLGAAGSAHAAMSLSTEGIKGKKANVLQKVTVVGDTGTASTDPVEIRINVANKDEEIEYATPAGGKFSTTIPVTSCCTYKITAIQNGVTAGTSFGVDVPKLKSSSKGPLVKLFHNKLIEQGFYVRKGKKYNSGTKLAILAFRKTNKMSRSTKYSAKIFRMLLQGRGAFPLEHPQEGPDGKHVEVDLSRQVMTLAEGGEPKHTFHVSSGTSGTPTVTGKFSFYLKHAGYNAKRMYYSVFFIGGYATHGYNPVPNYPASHGCVRNPIPYSRFIYNWIDLGDPIWVYH